MDFDCSHMCVVITAREKFEKAIDIQCQLLALKELRRCLIFVNSTHVGLRRRREKYDDRSGAHRRRDLSREMLPNDVIVLTV
jgi:hypothetical protein